jgi:hypothetical protein
MSTRLSVKRGLSLADARELSLSQTLRSGKATIDDLNDDILGEVLGFLGADELPAFSLVNRRFAGIASSDAVWKTFLERDFSSSAAQGAGAAAPVRPTIGRELSRYGVAAAAMSSLGASTRTAIVRMVPSRLRTATPGGAANNTSLLDRQSGLPNRSSSLDGLLLDGAPKTGAGRSSAASAGGNTPAASPKDLYLAKFKGVIKDRANQKQQAERAASTGAALHRGRKLRILLDLIGYFIGLGMPLACVAVWMLLVTLKITAATPDMSWNSVFVPIWVGLISCAVALFVGCVTGICSRRCGDRSMCNRQDDGNDYTPWGFFRAWIEATKGGRSSGGCYTFFSTAWMFLACLLAFVIFPICLWAKLSGRVDSNWAVVFLPVWFVFLLWCCTPCCSGRVVEEITGDSDDSVWGYWGVSLIALWAPLLATLAMVVARLEGKYIASALMFIPFWIVDACLLLFTIVIAIVAATDDDPDDKKREWTACGVMAGLLVMWLPAQITAAVYDSKYGYISPLGFCIPILLGLIVIGGFGCWCSFKLLQTSRRDSWSDVYRAATWTRGGGNLRGGAGILPGNVDARTVRNMMADGGAAAPRRVGLGADLD